MSINKIEAIIAICIALTVFRLVTHHFMQTVMLKLEKKC